MYTLTEPDSFVISDHGLTIMFTSKNELLIDISIISVSILEGIIIYITAIVLLYRISLLVIALPA